MEGCFSRGLSSVIERQFQLGLAHFPACLSNLYGCKCCCKYFVVKWRAVQLSRCGNGIGYESYGFVLDFMWLERYIRLTHIEKITGWSRTWNRNNFRGLWHWKLWGSDSPRLHQSSFETEWERRLSRRSLMRSRTTQSQEGPHVSNYALASPRHWAIIRNEVRTKTASQNDTPFRLGPDFFGMKSKMYP